MKALNELTATEAAEAIAHGKTSSRDLVEACLTRVREREAEIGAWIYLDVEAARSQARACDRGPVRGPLHGVPIGIKDIIDTHDMPTAYGSAIYSGHQPTWDAPCVALLRAAGAVILGKTVTTEFAMFTPGKTANPHNSTHTPGGSSSGSAAAVADYMIPLALGTQTAGSVIRPASYCGVFGYKPSHGDFAIAGIKALSQTLDTLGGFARSIDDLALLRAVLVRAPSGLTSLSRPPRIGLCRTPQWPQATADTQQALETAAARLADAGADMHDVDLAPDFDALCQAQETIQVFEGAHCCAYELTHHRDQLSPRLIALLEPGDQITYTAYTEALGLAERCRRHIEGLFDSYDALLVPSAPGEAPEGLGATGDPLFNRMWTLLHTPAVNLPGLKGANGLPVGVQTIGPIGQDDRLLAMAAWMQTRLA